MEGDRIAFGYNIIIQVNDLEVTKLHFNAIKHYDISEINLLLWDNQIYIGFYEHDDEAIFLFDLFLFLKDQNTEQIILNGLEHYLDELKEIDTNAFSFFNGVII